MKRGTRVFLGILTLAPVLCAALLFSGALRWSSGSAAGTSLATVISAVFVASLVLSVGVTIFWAIDIYRRADMNQDRKALWMVIVIFGTVVGQAAYFLVEVWPERSLLDVGPQGLSSESLPYPPTAPYQPPPPSERPAGNSIVHIVFWRLKDSADGRPKAENAAEMKRRIEALGTVMPWILRLDVGINFESSAAAWDVALYSEFASEADLAEYQAHPDHVKVAEWIAGVREGRAVVDYRLPQAS